MKIGFGLEPIRGLPMDLIVRLMKMTLIQHFEFNWRIIPKVELVIKSLKRSTTTFHLPIFNRDRFDFSTKSDTFEVQMQEVTSFINSRNKDINISYTLAHFPEDPNGSYDLMFSRLAQIDTPIVLENVVGPTDDEFMDFYLQAKDYLGSHLAGHCLDISHRYINNWKTWLDLPKELEKDIEYVHISDCTKTEDLHLPLGLGEMPFDDFFDYLKKIRYNGVIMQELKPNGDQAEEIMTSGLHCAKPFTKIKYLRMLIRRAILRPILRRRQKDFEDLLDKTAEEIGFDFV
ncbi:MAG: TIM barrel protein [Candidatus Heimdallarchaeota archaeon]